MPYFELSKLQATSAARPLSQSDRTQTEVKTGRANITSPNAANTGVSLEVGSGIDASTPPVNQNRVQEIREALRDGSYPLVPTKIVDAIIAARVSFEIEPE
ncbi:MAG: flagellar biosynthesis anti-sigma factor FlgM [Pseudomonadota bacterium]